MAHLIDQSKGKAAFVAFQAEAWHGLGKVFTEEITVDQALKEGGLDFTVEKLPNIHRLPNDTQIVSEDSFFTYCTDTMKVLGGRLGSDYKVYQNTDALSVVDDLIKTGKVKIETAGAIQEGRRIFICLKFQEPIKVGSKDVIYQYLLLTTSHDGTLAITAFQTNVRVVCHNTLSAALGGAQHAHKIRHSSQAHDRVKEAFTLMGLLENNQKQNEAAYNAMKNTVVSKQEFFDYIGNVFMDEAEIKELQKGNKDAISSRKKNILEGVFEFANTGVGQQEALGDGNLNMWYGYNAITGFLTSKKYKSEDDRFNSLILGDSASKIKVAGELALHPSKIQTLKQKPNFILN